MKTEVKRIITKALVCASIIIALINVMPRQLLLLSPLLLKKAEEQFLPALKRRHGMSAFIMASCRDACGQILGGFG